MIKSVFIDVERDALGNVWITCCISAPDLIGNLTGCIAYHHNNRCNTYLSFSSSKNVTSTSKTSLSSSPPSLQPDIIIIQVPPAHPGPTASTISGIPTTASVRPPVACPVSSSPMADGLNKQQHFASTILRLKPANDKFHNSSFLEGKCLLMALRLSDP